MTLTVIHIDGIFILFLSPLVWKLKRFHFVLDLSLQHLLQPVAKLGGQSILKYASFLEWPNFDCHYIFKVGVAIGCKVNGRVLAFMAIIH